MSAEVCLLLIQSLTGDCEPPVTPESGSMAAIATQPEIDETATATTATGAIAPAESPTAPRFGELCAGAHAERLAVCAVPSQVQQSWTAPRAMPSSSAAVAPERVSPPTAPSATTQPAVSVAPAPAVTTPVALDIPEVPRAVPLPAAQLPQFSLPVEVAAVSPRPARVEGRRPGSGSQLYVQRLLALRSGRSYTRLSPDAYADQWNQATRQPTYQDWQRLLAQEARAIAGGQGSNRLEVVVGDSFGLWLPPDMLPRDRLWLNQSISGDTTAGILQRISTFANTRATTIHLMAGANDLKNGVPEAQIAYNLRQTVRQLRQQHPQAQIVVYSVLPTRRAEISNDRVRSLNARLATISQQDRVEFRNVHPRFQDEQGHLRPDLTTDGLHLNAQGYAVWQRAMLARAW
ncbi:MAG: GDSL-type esterase/lipase family protein [Cyanobacteria bacterium P01_H01_bin.162]